MQQQRLPLRVDHVPRHSRVLRNPQAPLERRTGGLLCHGVNPADVLALTLRSPSSCTLHSTHNIHSTISGGSYFSMGQGARGQTAPTLCGTGAGTFCKLEGNQNLPEHQSRLTWFHSGFESNLI